MPDEPIPAGRVETLHFMRGLSENFLRLDRIGVIGRKQFHTRAIDLVIGNG